MTAKREFSPFADSEAKELLRLLVQEDISAESYRGVMERLGHGLAKGALARYPELFRDKQVCVVCTVEDADFLARGIIDELEAVLPKANIHLQCLWNEKVREHGISLSPISKQYREPFNTGRTTYIVVKSIISGACVVKTNVTRALSADPYADVVVAAPVLLDGASSRLAKEFPPQISARFNYIWFATDFEKDGENVRPGIGGSVYERLGLGDEHEKNNYLPEIVKRRRAERFAAV